MPASLERHPVGHLTVAPPSALEHTMVGLLAVPCMSVQVWAGTGTAGCVRAVWW